MTITSKTLQGFKLHALRILSKQTAKDVSQFLDITQTYLSMIENGTKPVSKKIIKNISSILGGNQAIQVMDSDVEIVRKLLATVDPKHIMMANSVIESQLREQMK
jgi:transcriptional regulator with XRE-family HTH domain